MTAGGPGWTAASASGDDGSARFVRLAHLRKLLECEQVAAVCHRVRDGRIEFLLVQTRGSGRWTFPKGSVEPGLTHSQAAALEAFEEAGVHGRIEEASFARYVLGKRSSARKSASKAAGKELAVNAHLCEVLRLGNPEESHRERTWFSAEDAKQRLREGRHSADGAALARVVDKAVARVQRLSGEGGIVSHRRQQPRTQPYAPPQDPLQKVQFDLTEARRWMQTPNLPGSRRKMRKFPAPLVDVHSREILQCDILQFDRSRELNRSTKYLGSGKKAKALGAGAKGA